jgi:hypothetical protein
MPADFELVAKLRRPVRLDWQYAASRADPPNPYAGMDIRASQGPTYCQSAVTPSRLPTPVRAWKVADQVLVGSERALQPADRRDTQRWFC